MIADMILTFLLVFFIVWLLMSLVWLYLNRQQARQNEKLETISKIVKETHMDREHAEKLYDLFMNGD